jgi:hypothetical protein
VFEFGMPRQFECVVRLRSVMTIRYCDFCGDTIPEGLGDPVTLADVESLPEAAKDACEPCVAILWDFTRHKNLRTIASTRISLPDPQTAAYERTMRSDPQTAAIQPQNDSLGSPVGADSDKTVRGDGPDDFSDLNLES